MAAMPLANWDSVILPLPEVSRLENSLSAWASLTLEGRPATNSDSLSTPSPLVSSWLKVLAAPLAAAVELSDDVDDEDDDELLSALLEANRLWIRVCSAVATLSLLVEVESPLDAVLEEDPSPLGGGPGGGPDGALAFIAETKSLWSRLPLPVGSSLFHKAVA